MGWTLSQSRSDGRYSEVETFAGAALPSAFGGANTNSTGVVKSFSDANASTVEDQAGKKRRSITNALGQLTRVDEPNDAGELGTIASPNQATYYTYNTLGNMVKVTQGVQNRYFMHDSLGRLLRVRQPEQEVNTGLNTTGNPDNNAWTMGATYDDNGNVLTATDANGVTITNTYDAMNRVLTRSYSDSTPTVTYTYDDTTNVPFSKGKLTKVSSSISETRYTEYDLAGRLIKSEQATDGQVYPSEYTYNLSGVLIEQKYPSGRVVKNVLDANGDISMIQGKPNENHGYWNYAKNFTYNAAGAITKVQLGNGLWETSNLNSRLQTTQMGLGTTSTGTGLWKVNYEFGELQTNGTVDQTMNNGNIGKQTLTIPGTDFVQTYRFDSLHRLVEAVEKTDTTTNWSQEFEYDRYGNRTSIDQAIGSLILNTTPTIDVNTNRFNPSQGFTYDKNGNIVNDIDVISSLPRQFIFNGDNKQIEVKKDGVTIGRYYYDGEGKRVKKVTDHETTIFVYAAGRLVAEYSTQTSQTPTVSYLTSDHLGTPRIITDQSGNVKARRDFMPFGEELYTGIGERTTSHKYGTSEDDVRQKFTGYQKDNETNLDFAEARMYTNNYGRFTAVDPLLASGKSANPQTFNRYIYVANNPIVYKDPTGLDRARAVSSELDEEGKEVIKPLTEADREALRKNLNKLAPGTKVREDGTIKRPGFFRRAMNRMSGHSVGTRLVSEISKSNVEIRVNNHGRNDAVTTDAQGRGDQQNVMGGISEAARVYWDPNAKVTGIIASPDGPVEVALSSALSLGHELIHAYNNTRPPGRDGVRERAANKHLIGGHFWAEMASKSELRTIGLGFNMSNDITEHKLAKELGEPKRLFHGNPVNCSGSRGGGDACR